MTTGGLQRLRAKAWALLRSPVAWVLSGAFVLYTVGLGWGLPASDTWDNDGVAPRDFLVAVSQSFDKGGFDFAYLHLAPFHLLLLALVTLPITAVALAHVDWTDPQAIIHQIIQTPYMTAIAYVARMVSVVMALGVVWALACVAAESRGRRAAALVALVCASNAALVYYAHVTNLEVPYLFWASLALLALVRAIARREPRRLRTFAALGAIAIGCKDQAAGLFLLGAPLSVAFWLATVPWAREHRREVVREACLALGIAAAVFLLADEVVLNPQGFAARVHFLLGPASKDHGEYTSDWTGRAAVLADIVRNFTLGYPKVFAALALVGLAFSARGEPPSASGDAGPDVRGAAMVPLFAALSFTVCINLTALRSEHRFILPQLVVAGLYAGLGLDVLVSAPRSRWIRRVTYAAALGAFAVALFQSAAVDAALLGDPRYEAEAYLQEHAAASAIETYGLNVYLPRFPAGARVVRVGPEPARGRSPLPGVVELEDDYAGVDRRRPRWIVVSFAWVAKYLADPGPESFEGHIVPRAQRVPEGDAARAFFRELLAGKRGYRVACFAEWRSTIWPRVDIHASTELPVWVLERVERAD